MGWNFQRAAIQTMIQDFKDLCNMIHIHEYEILYLQTKIKTPIKLHIFKKYIHTQGS